MFLLSFSVFESDEEEAEIPQNRESRAVMLGRRLLVEDFDNVLIRWFFRKLPESFGFFNMSASFVKAFSESHHTAKCDIPSIHSSSVEGFRYSRFTASTLDQLVDLLSIEVCAVDECVACLACTQNQVVHKRGVLQCF